MNKKNKGTVKEMLLILFLLTATSFTSDSTGKRDPEECDIEKIYKSMELPYGAKAIDSYGDVIDIESILVPVEDITPGKYSISVSEVGDNMYEIDGMDLYIETSLCIELAILDNAVLIVEQYQGHTFGKIIFID
jgi:hypothetical protein